MYRKLPEVPPIPSLLTSQDRIKLVCAMKHLRDRSHPALRQCSPSKDVRCVIRDLVSRPGRISLQQAYGAGEVCRLGGVGHVVHLIDGLFEPGLVGLDEGDHFGELLADDRLGDERFAEDEALVGPFEAFFKHGTHPAIDHCCHHETFLGLRG